MCQTAHVYIAYCIFEQRIFLLAEVAHATTSVHGDVDGAVLVGSRSHHQSQSVGELIFRYSDIFVSALAYYRCAGIRVGGRQTGRHVNVLLFLYFLALVGISRHAGLQSLLPELLQLAFGEGFSLFGVVLVGNEERLLTLVQNGLEEFLELAAAGIAYQEFYLFHILVPCHIAVA
jgi:hypothetical protein